MADLSRRGFFGGLAGIVAGSASLQAEPRPTKTPRITIDGWSVRWQGWQRSPNQMITYGVWTASQPGRDRFLYATTLGHVGDAADLYVLDLSLKDGWPILSEVRRAEDPEQYRTLAIQLRMNAFRLLQETIHG